MRLARVQHDGGAAFVTSKDGRTWHTLATPARDLPEAIDVLSLGQDQTGKEVEVDTTAVLCPVVRPSKILAIGLNYAAHARETGATPPPRPIVFAKYPNSLNDPYGDVRIPPSVTEQADYEAELAVIIGRRAKQVTREQALDHVFGYAVANDVSSRDWQRADSQFSRSKSADTFCPIGPWITTTDEIPRPHDLRITSRVNGEVRQDSTTADLIFDIPALIEFLTSTITLEPGDVILTGTPQGVGLGFNPPRFLRPGDVVECEVEGLGTIRNRFVDE
jgi:2-keto-4-pentenoate hydratase/2-oxohepta-3-ene-1,7-dioic acid hydratase in catechol pathway